MTRWAHEALFHATVFVAAIAAYALMDLLPPLTAWLWLACGSAYAGGYVLTRWCIGWDRTREGGK